MGISIAITIWCDSCSKHEYFEDSITVTRSIKHARSELQKKGWTHRTSNYMGNEISLDNCPECTDRRTVIE